MLQTGDIVCLYQNYGIVTKLSKDRDTIYILWFGNTESRVFKYDAWKYRFGNSLIKVT